MVAQSVSILTDDELLEAVERVNDHLVRCWADEAQQSLPHAAGRRLGVGQAQNFLRTGTGLLQQPGHPGGQQLRSTRPGPGHHQQGSVGVSHRFALAGVEAGEFGSERGERWSSVERKGRG